MINLKRIGNILEVSPANEAILQPALSYTYVAPTMGRASGQKTSASSKFIKAYEIVGDKLYTMQGATHLVEDKLKSMDLEYQYSYPGRKKLVPDFENLSRSMPTIKYKANQKEALAKIIVNDCGIVVAPTAFGKTFLMIVLTQLFPDARFLMLTPSSTLFDSTYARVLEHTTDISRIGNGYSEDDARITICTFRSILKAASRNFDIVIVDECHGIMASDTSRNFSMIKEYSKVIGFSATPFGRNDGTNIAVKVLLGPVIFETSYKEAAERGSVSSIIVNPVSVNINNPHPCLQSESFQSVVAKKRNLYWNNRERNKAFATALQTVRDKFDIREDFQSLLLVSTVQHAFNLHKYLPDYTVVYSSISDDKIEKFMKMKLLPEDFSKMKPKELKALKEAFENDELKHVIATSTWGTGLDFVNLDVVANASGETSSIISTQWSGRVSRVIESKPFGILIDSIDQWDPWANRRAMTRFRLYKKEGHKILKQKE